MQRRLLSLALLLALCLGLAVPALAASPFTDVPESHWAYDSVMEAYNDGVLQGVGGGRFAPEGALTLAQWSVMLARGYYRGEIGTKPEQNWYNRQIAVLDDHGIFNGIDAGLPVDAVLSRSDMAVMIWNLLRDQGAAMPTAAQLRAAAGEIRDLNDTPAAQRDAVAACFHLGILNGTAPGTFSGTQSVRRDAASAVYARVRDYLEAAADPETPEEPKAPEDPETPEEPKAPEVPETPEEPKDPEVPETPEAPEASEALATLANGQPITEENVRAIILGLQPQYPEGTPWTNANDYVSEGVWLHGYGCSAFALICSDAAFGQLPVTDIHSDFARIRVGDILRVNSDTHSVVVLEKRADSVVVTEGNYNSSIHWGREITRKDLENGSYYVRTRYPQ